MRICSASRNAKQWVNTSYHGNWYYQKSKQTSQQQQKNQKTASVGENVEKLDPLCIAAGKREVFSKFATIEKDMALPEEFKIELPYESAIPL